MNRIKLFIAAIGFVALAACQAQSPKSASTASADTLISEGIYRTTIGDMELYSLLDVESTMGKELFPELDSNQVKRLMPQGKAPSAITVFLLKRNGKNILFDTGVGATFFAKLQTIGLNADVIDAVIISHFHGDHIGGLLNNGNATFAKAKLFLPKAEVDAFKNGVKFTNNLESIAKMLEVYGDRITEVEPEVEFYENIVGHSAEGHTPGHTVYEVDGFVFAGDLLHAASVQFENPNVCAVYDFDKGLAVKSRLQYFDWAANAKITLAATHLPFPSVIKDFSTVWTPKK